MGDPQPTRGTFGKWMALTAALLGWMFDGLEMGLFSLVGRPAITDLLTDRSSGVAVAPSEDAVAQAFGVAIACFLVGAATGGVLFGWLGDRIGRVRAMTLSVLTYAIFSALGGLALSTWQLAGLRFIAALGMGGEWSLGVALVMEVWPNQSRALLAGMIGAAGNVGYVLIAVVGLGLSQILTPVREGLLSVGMTEGWVEWLVRNRGWRIIMLTGAFPAVLTFFIRLFVPESERWEAAKGTGATAHWTNSDLLGVVFGAACGCGIIAIWADDFGLPFGAALAVRVPATLVLFTGALAGFLVPVMRYLKRRWPGVTFADARLRQPMGRLLLGATLSGIPLLATWASIQWAGAWAQKLGSPEDGYRTQFWSALGAVIACVLGALLGDWVGRRAAYSCLCVLALAASLLFFQQGAIFGEAPVVGYQFLFLVFLAGGASAAFYGWLPLYLPELFPTYIRATGQGFSFNIGRIIAAIGALQLWMLMRWFDRDYSIPCSIMSLVYVVGLAVIWLAPETRGKPLPE